VAVTCRWRSGDWCTEAPIYIRNKGQALAASTYAGRLSVLRVFFRDLQEWEMIPRRFDPGRSFVNAQECACKDRTESTDYC